jgi:Cullin, a subunit of E3 ubiquitin ligase
LTKYIENKQYKMTEVIKTEKSQTIHEIEKIINSYGNYKLKTTIKKNIFNGIKIDLKNAETMFLDFCTRIFSNDNEINQRLVEIVVFVICNENPDFIKNTLINLFDNYTKMVSQSLQEIILSNNFTLKKFIDNYNIFDRIENFLKNILSYYNNNTYFENSKKYKYTSLINVIKDATIYVNILNKKYVFDNSEKWLCKIISHFMSNEISIYDDIYLSPLVDNILIIYNIFTKNKNINKENCNIIINTNKFDDPFNNKLIEMINNEINSSIILLFESHKRYNIHKIKNIIRMGLNLCDKTLFTIIYRRYLTNRLKEFKTNPEIEADFLDNIFPYKFNPQLFAKMKYQIHDACLRKEHEACFKNVSIKIESEKFKHLKVEDLDKTLVNILLMRSYAWDDNNSIETYNLPPELDVHFVKLLKIYKNNYPDNDLIIAHNECSGTLKMKLAENVDYNINMTLSQLAIIILICSKTKISALDISKYLGIRLSKLGMILNSLIDVGLIVRDVGAANNPRLLFSINWNCKFDDTNVSIISILNKLQNIKNETISSNDLPKINTTILKAKLLATVSKLKTCSVDKLKEELDQNLGIKIPLDLINQEIQTNIESGHLIKENDMLKYTSDPKNKNDLDLDFDFEKDLDFERTLENNKIKNGLQKIEDVNTILSISET